MCTRPVLRMLCFGLLSSCSVPVAGPDDALSSRVRGVLLEQVSAWNQGDLSLFMETYWNSDQLTFFSGGNKLSGWQQTLARYQRRYASDGAGMGDLTFEDLAIEMLGDSSAFVRGRYRLRRDGEHTGLFTVVLRRLPEGWKIVHDHTSTAP